MFSVFTESNRCFGEVCSLVYNATTLSVGGGAALVAAPLTLSLLAIVVHGRDVVEGPAITLGVLDHQVMLTAHQVVCTNLLASLELATQDVLDPLAGLGLRSEVGRGVRVHSLTGIRSIEYLPAPAPVLAIGALARLYVQELSYVEPWRQRLVIFSDEHVCLVLSCRS